MSADNPFQHDDPDRRAVWEMLVARDIAAFVAADWGMVADDFRGQGFLGLHAHGSDNPDGWTLAFPTLDAYRDEWLRQARTTLARDFAEPLGPALHALTDLRDIDLKGNSAVAHKKFDGTLNLADGTREVLNWQTLYFCAKEGGRWRITGFVGYLPSPMGRARG